MNEISEPRTLIIGGGGREISIGWRFKRFDSSHSVYMTGGNGLSGVVAFRNFTPAPENFEKLCQFVQKYGIDLAVIGPDRPLADGVTDAFLKAGIRVFGPTKAASKIEWSKSYGKEIMRAANIPTADYISTSSYDEAIAFAEKLDGKVVVKADGLADGKGVKVCRSMRQVRKALTEILIKRKFGKAGERVVVEKRLYGTEISAHAFCDGTSCILLPLLRDHKHLHEGNKGPMTGGMGIYGPIKADPAFMAWVKNSVILPTLKELSRRGTPFIGCLYVGLMLTQKGPMVLEYNARMGDPETQGYMRLLEDRIDLRKVFRACAEQKLNERLHQLNWRNEKCVAVSITSAGYGKDKPKIGRLIKLAKRESGHEDPGVLFHCNTLFDYEKGFYRTNGGRVFTYTRLVPPGTTDLSVVYEEIKSLVRFRGMHFRRDIGKDTSPAFLV